MTFDWLILIKAKQEISLQIFWWIQYQAEL